MATKYIRNDSNYDSYLFIAGIDTKYTVLIQPKKCKYFLWLLITKIKFTIFFGTAKELFWLRKTNSTRKRNFPIKYAKIYSFNHKLWGIKFAFFFSGSHHTLEFCSIRLTLQAQEKTRQLVHKTEKNMCKCSWTEWERWQSEFVQFYHRCHYHGTVSL